MYPDHDWLIYIYFLLGITVLIIAERLHGRYEGAEKQSWATSAIWSGMWILSAMLFGGWLWKSHGSITALSFLTGYLVELALSVDNLFVFILIFRFFAVPPKAQERALTYGIIGAIVMRAFFIAIGVSLLNRFAWITVLLGVVLIVTGYKLFFQKLEEELHPGDNWLYRFFSKLLPSTKHYVDDKFFHRDGGKLLATPLFFVVLVIESTDLAFAIDSIPAIFGITTDPFIIFTSNVLAVIGLRALYAVVATVLLQIAHLNRGLALILGFIGVEMLLAPYFHLPIQYSLAFVVITLLGTISLSLRKSASHIAD